jgi:NIPSNAP
VDRRIFEFRTYRAGPGKLQALHDRFRDHTMALFAKHSMEVIGFWQPVESDTNTLGTLVYVLAFPSVEAAAKSWHEFVQDPEWIRVKAESQPDGVPLVESMESCYMSATDYSPLVSSGPPAVS